jgi:hypothetical protein
LGDSPDQIDENEHH